MPKTSKSLRKSPKQGRSKVLVDAILEAATRILKKAGYNKTSTNWVAEAAGVSIGSLYQYFPNKDSIVSFLIDQSIRTYVQQTVKKLSANQAATVQTATESFIQYTADLFYTYKDELRAIFK